MRIVIDVNRDYEPRDQDILVFNKSKNCWECEQKSYVLKEQDKKIEEMKKDIANLKADYNNYQNKINEKISILASAIKEFIK
ncbi:MAG: hypothetical protein PHU32_05660 [Candidatus ainarchaeum sp.]|jgi:hypothetical protein|nr:hypothetical protein [Clostridia bacterium]MDD3085343.1 hypothetical protein [Candidatus ainarchaeum sp.]